MDKKSVVDYPHISNDRSCDPGKEMEQVMEIKRGRYILRSDAACCWIDEEYVSDKSGKLITKNVSGYYPNFRMLAETGLPSHLIRSSEAKSMKRLVEDVKKMEEKISRMTFKKTEELLKGEKK
ncbi:MAG: hypothetical protein II656_05055 [Ruminococcus sp.]|nr:hypothetical protein [Ruminococcus sp.]